ncbi:MAG: GH3 auxin-responsive promoter family protein [Bacteroidales bacterium]|nr:GH3 auxin-responsive promoter family protein [Bacteroidales bacterium]
MPIIGSIIKRAIELRSLSTKENQKSFDGCKAQHDVLKSLLRKAQFTHFGEEHDFSEILRSKDIIGEFKKKLPVHDYDLIFKKWWYRSLNGEAFVTWPGKVKHFALSSGTSGASSKYIPVTTEMLKSIKKTSVRQLLSLAQYNFPPEFFEKGKGILMLGGSTHLQYNGTYYAGDLSGITTGNIPFWFQVFYKPGKRISKERDWNTKLDEIVKNAKNWDIGVIVGVPAWLQILLERIIKTYNLKHIHEIWPNLSIYVHGGVSFAPYYKGFERLLGHPLTYMETYLASEGFIAYQKRPGVDSMQMSLDTGLFFEFVPFNESNFDNDGNIVANPETITLKDVEEEKEYALLISSNAGAWRYLIGDTIKFTSKKLNEIRITGRTKHFLSLCGEHLSQDNMNRAVELMSNDLNIEVREFTVAGIKHGSMFAHKWFLGTDDPLDPDEAKERIDNHLKQLNDDYRVERIAAIKDVIVEILPAKVFYDWMRDHGKEGAQNKFPRVIKAKQLDEWEKYVDNFKNN